MVERVLHREHAAPRLPDDDVAVGDPELVRERDELVLEERAVQKSTGASGRWVLLPQPTWS